MAGLLAACALARHFARVTVVERDAAPEAPGHRKGVPQDQHIHVLLRSGAEILERFFPGFTQELIAAGAETFDCGRDARWFHHGVWKSRPFSGVPLLAQSRPFLEWHLRRRLALLPNVAFAAGDAVELLADARQAQSCRVCACAAATDRARSTTSPPTSSSKPAAAAATFRNGSTRWATRSRRKKPW